VAQKKGSYDPSYAAAKSGLVGVQHTLANRFPHVNFNTLSLGLVENSPVHRGMTDDYVHKHLNAMGGNLIKVDDVCASIYLLLEGHSISNSIISIDRGFK
jgi:NAD(P)-dependent dehydrogenase (short-subunit alcohol dehydrogenase family)